MVPETRPRRHPSSLDGYLCAIARTPLLSAEKEWELGRQVQSGRDPETATLRQRAAAQKARDVLITSNLRLAVSLARCRQGRGWPLDDLIQAANLGLFMAVERYDPSRRIRFSTYATYWIKQQLGELIYRATGSTLVRTPAYVQEMIAKLRKRGLPPTAEGVRELGLPSRQSRCVEAGLRLAARSVLQEYEEDNLSLLVDSRTESGPASALYREALDALEESLAELDERSQEVVRLRYGLAGEPLTLEKIGRQMGITKERVRQIERDALEKLRVLMS